MTFAAPIAMPHPEALKASLALRQRLDTIERVLGPAAAVDRFRAAFDDLHGAMQGWAAAVRAEKETAIRDAAAAVTKADAATGGPRRAFWRWFWARLLEVFTDTERDIDWLLRDVLGLEGVAADKRVGLFEVLTREPRSGTDPGWRQALDADTRPPAGFSHWLAKAVRGAARDQDRMKALPSEAPTPIGPDAPDQRLEAESLREAVLAADLSAREREALAYLLAQEADREAMAAAMGITRGNADKIVSTLRAKLRKIAAGS